MAANANGLYKTANEHRSVSSQDGDCEEDYLLECYTMQPERYCLSLPGDHSSVTKMEAADSSRKLVNIYTVPYSREQSSLKQTPLFPYVK
jgi:hypothetical protein